jgi:hypothetical protein
MAIIEREPAAGPVPREPERPVFLAADGRRARRLRVVAAAVTVLALLWLVALAAGSLGFGSLPGFSVPELPTLGGGGTPPPGPDPAQPSDARGVAGRIADATTRSGGVATSSRGEPVSAPQRRGTVAAPGKAKAVRTQPWRPAPAQPATPVQPPQTQVPAQPLTGREQRGLPAPPGHVRKTEPAPPPPGNRRGQETTPPPPPAPPPPPPPPPPGNGLGGGLKK